MKKIAIIGAPGSGKTTLAQGLSYYLKINQKHVEYVPELVKYKVFKESDFKRDGFDIQNTLEQQELEHIFNSSKAKQEIDFLICEAPLCNGFFYSVFYNKNLESPILKEIAIKNINNYDLILFVKKIENAEYVSFGRKETEEQSFKFEELISTQLEALNYQGKIFEVNQKTKIDDILKLII